MEEVATIDLEEKNDILVVTNLGFGKRTAVSEFRVQQRGGYGVTLVKLTDKNGKVAAIRHVHEDDQVMMVSENGMLIRIKVNEISRYGRAAQGVRVIRLGDGDQVVSVARVVDNEEEDEMTEETTDEITEEMTEKNETEGLESSDETDDEAS